LPRTVRTEWVVYAKPPWGGPATVLKYLARYTHRAAISNRRLVDLADGRVTFGWKDYAHEGRPGTMTLEAVEFVRRFLMHVLPRGFVRVRRYGLLATATAGRSWRGAGSCSAWPSLRRPTRPRPIPTRSRRRAAKRR
jgi:hypothetical protein